MLLGGPVLNLNTYDESMLVTDREKLVVFVKQKGLLTFKDGIESVKVNNIFDINKPLSKVNAAYFFELVEQRLFDKNSDIINKLGINISTVDYANFVDALYMSWNSNFLSYVVSFKTFVRIFVDVFGGEGFKSTNSEAVEVLKTVYDDCVEEMNIRAGKPLEMSGVEKSDEEIQKQFDVWAAESILSTPAGAIWNITRNLGILLSKTVPVQPKQTYHGLIGKLNPRAMVSWTHVLRTVLGYVGAVDFDKGLIHRNEPTQAVWFSKDVCNVVDTVLNYNVKPSVNKKDSQNLSVIQKSFDDELTKKYGNNIYDMILGNGLNPYNKYAQNLNLSNITFSPTIKLLVYYNVYCNKQIEQFFPILRKNLINSFNQTIANSNNMSIREKFVYEPIIMFLEKNQQFFNDVQQFKEKFVNCVQETATNLYQQINQSSINPKGKQHLSNQIKTDMEIFIKRIMDIN